MQTPMMSYHVGPTWHEWNANPSEVRLTWFTLKANSSDVRLAMHNMCMHGKHPYVVQAHSL